MPPKKVDKKSGKAEKAPAKPEKAKPKYKKPTPMPPDIREAMGKPIPTRTSASTRNSLFPYLALGFTPVETSARGWLCGVNALWRSYRNARDALKSPDDEPIKHATQKVFQGLLRSKEYADVFKEHLLAWQDPFMTDEFINEQIDNSRLPNNFDITTVSHILGAANRRWGTDFELGVITQGFRVRWNAETEAWDGDFVSDTHLSIPLGDASGRPIVWVYNNNVEVANLGRGGKGGVGHWEGFGPPNHSDAAHRNLVRSWNLGAAMREHIKMGTWRVIVGQEATNGQIAVQVGAFVHEVPVPAGFNVIEGMRYVATADEQHFGLIPNESLIRIELHDTAPTDVPGGAKNKNEEDSKHNKKGENDIHDDKRKEMVDIVNSFVVSVANTLAIFRTVTPTNRIGGQLTEDELPLFTRDRFQSGLGEFLLDLGKRDGHWVLVRTIDGKEGWVHERGLQLLERPWNLPSCPPFNVTWSPHNWSWCQDEIDDQLRKRGLSSSGSRETDFGRIINYERTRTASLPMKVVDYDDEEQERPRWSDSSEILDKELVLEAAVVDNVATEITSFDRETWVIGSDELIHVPQAAWGINMTPEELTALMATVRVTSTASEQVLNKAEERKSKEKEPIKKSDEKAKRVALDAVEGLSFSGEKKSKKQELGAEEDGPSSPKEKGNSKNSNGKHLLEDGEEDELAQEPQQPPKKSPKTKIKK